AGSFEVAQRSGRCDETCDAWQFFLGRGQDLGSAIQFRQQKNCTSDLRLERARQIPQLRDIFSLQRFEELRLQLGAGLRGTRQRAEHRDVADGDARVARAGELQGVAQQPQDLEIDRKSTRLNSSHVSISYAVFCLK